VCILAALLLLLSLLLASEEEPKEESFAAEEEILDRVLRWRTILRISCPLVRTHYIALAPFPNPLFRTVFFLFDLLELVSSFEVCDTINTQGDFFSLVGKMCFCLLLFQENRNSSPFRRQRLCHLFFLVT
jgi:hypothetical protein